MRRTSMIYLMQEGNDTTHLLGIAFIFIKPAYHSLRRYSWKFFFYLFFLLTMHLIKKCCRIKDKTNTKNNTKNSVVEHKTLKNKV